ncbi:MAG: hypothetical protein JST54_12455 [Deltaproteobacteria bacterium]|nr:hypothetical protein [Deltaproteobacteria bacterium]
MPDAPFWNDIHGEPGVPDDMETLKAEVRRLRHALIRVHDRTDDLTSQRGHEVHGIAQEALRWVRPRT